MVESTEGNKKKFARCIRACHVRQHLTDVLVTCRKYRCVVLIQEMFLVVAMGPPGGGRSVISERLQSRFNLFNMTFPQVCQSVCLCIRAFCRLYLQPVCISVFVVLTVPGFQLQ